jgi:hypothetical protein
LSNIPDNKDCAGSGLGFSTKTRSGEKTQFNYEQVRVHRLRAKEGECLNKTGIKLIGQGEI